MSEKVDITALKFNQASIIVFTGLAFLLNNEWLAGIVGIILIFDSLIPGTGLFKLFYRNLIKPLKIIKPIMIEESRTPHQFAQGMGGSFIILSFVLLKFFDLQFVGWGLSLLVILFAFVNLTLNFCAGCFIYFQIEKLKPLNKSTIIEKKNA